MPTIRALRLSVMIFCVLMALLFGASFLESEILPPVLREWTDTQSLSLPLAAATLLALLGLAVGSVALLVQKKWGAWLHLASSGLGTIVACFMGPVVYSSLVSTIDSLLMIVSGFIYGIAFFTDAFAPVKTSPNQPLQPTALLGRG